MKFSLSKVKFQIEYRILSFYDIPNNLELSINKLLNQGWQLDGDISVTSVKDRLVYTQCVTRTIKADD